MPIENYSLPTCPQQYSVAVEVDGVELTVKTWAEDEYEAADKVKAWAKARLAGKFDFEDRTSNDYVRATRCED